VILYERVLLYINSFEVFFFVVYFNVSCTKFNARARLSRYVWYGGYSSKSCCILGLTCCIGTSSWDAMELHNKCTSVAALDSEGVTTQAAVTVGETVTCCVVV
jgi:hypothetical protein